MIFDNYRFQKVEIVDCKNIISYKNTDNIIRGKNKNEFLDFKF